MVFRVFRVRYAGNQALGRGGPRNRMRDRNGLPYPNEYSIGKWALRHFSQNFPFGKNKDSKFSRGSRRRSTRVEISFFKNREMSMFQNRGSAHLRNVKFYVASRAQKIGVPTYKGNECLESFPFVGAAAGLMVSVPGTPLGEGLRHSPRGVPISEPRTLNDKNRENARPVLLFMVFVVEWKKARTVAAVRASGKERWSRSFPICTRIVSHRCRDLNIPALNTILERLQPVTAGRS